MMYGNSICALAMVLQCVVVSLSVVGYHSLHGATAIAPVMPAGGAQRLFRERLGVALVRHHGFWSGKKLAEAVQVIFSHTVPSGLKDVKSGSGPVGRVVEHKRERLAPS
jgi:hypothetical protein